MNSNHAQTPTVRVLANTRAIIDQFGPRLAGTESCKQAAECLREQFAAICGQARIEPFQAHPLAFMGFYKINVAVYLFCLLSLFLNQPLPAALGFAWILVSGMLEFGYYKEFFDPIFPEKTCWNVWTTLEPQGEARQQIILSGHHDSPQELMILRYWQKMFVVHALGPDAFHISGFAMAWLWVFSGGLPYFVPFLRWFLVAGLMLVIPKFFIVTSRISPGAGDNLVASTMLVELARQFAAPKETGYNHLEHTRLIFASFDAEESALRGSRAYVKAHRAELAALPTYALNIDSIYNVTELQFMVSDLNGYVSLSKDVARECMEIAHGCGYPARLCQMKFGGGATDAAELSKAGIQATTIIAMPTGVIRDGLVYHTVKDTVDAIEPEAVEACLTVANEFIMQKERQIGG